MGAKRTGWDVLLSDLSLKVSRRVDKFRLRMTVYNKHIQYNALVEFQRKGAN